MGDKEGGEREEKVDWNLSAAIINQCSELLEKASKNLINGRPDRAHIKFKTIRELIVFKLNKDERKSMKKKEGILGSCLLGLEYIKKNRNQTKDNWWMDKETPKHKEFLRKNNPTVLFGEYQESLMDLMHKYGFMLGVKEDDSEVGWT